MGEDLGGGEKHRVLTLTFIPSHQGRGIIRMPLIAVLKNGAFWHIAVKGIA
jgi:hypothetical protein